MLRQCIIIILLILLCKNINKHTSESMHEDLTSIVKPPPFNEPKNLTIGLPETVGITRTNLNCHVSYYQYSSVIMNYTTFLSEAEHNICLLCTYICIEFLMYAVFESSKT